MQQGLLNKTDHLEITLNSSRDITSADPIVFEPEHQQESKNLIAESEYLHQAQMKLGELLRIGHPDFVSITEPDRQSVFRFRPEGGLTISLSRVHREIVRKSSPQVAHAS
jgi:hypothetical protein